MADALTTEAAADDEDGVNSPNTQKRLDFAAALKKDAPSPGVARRIIEGADGGVRIACVVPTRKSPRRGGGYAYRGGDARGRGDGGRGARGGRG